MVLAVFALAGRSVPSEDKAILRTGKYWCSTIHCSPSLSKISKNQGMNESRVGRSTLLKCQLTRLRYSNRYPTEIRWLQQLYTEWKYSHTIPVFCQRCQRRPQATESRFASRGCRRTKTYRNQYGTYLIPDTLPSLPFVTRPSLR